MITPRQRVTLGDEAEVLDHSRGVDLHTLPPVAPPSDYGYPTNYPLNESDPFGAPMPIGHWPPLHQFQGVVKDNSTITISAGYVLARTGASNAEIIATLKDATDKAVSGNGTIWAKVSLLKTYIATEDINSTLSATVEIDAVEYPVVGTVVGHANFDRVTTDAVVEYVTAVEDWNEDYGAVTEVGFLYVPILTFATVEGVLNITNQIQAGPISHTEVVPSL